MTSTIHIVEDNSALREALTLFLEEEGYLVHAYPDAEAFLDACSKAYPQGCLLLDMRLPGMGGLDLQHTLTQKRIFLPIVFMTGHGNAAASVTARQAGAVAFLDKPVPAEVLLATLESALGGGKH